MAFPDRPVPHESESRRTLFRDAVLSATTIHRRDPYIELTRVGHHSPSKGNIKHIESTRNDSFDDEEGGYELTLTRDNGLSIVRYFLTRYGEICHDDTPGRIRRYKAEASSSQVSQDVLNQRAEEIEREWLEAHASGTNILQKDAIVDLLSDIRESGLDTPIADRMALQGFDHHGLVLTFMATTDDLIPTRLYTTTWDTQAGIEYTLMTTTSANGNPQEVRLQRFNDTPLGRDFDTWIYAERERPKHVTDRFPLKPPDFRYNQDAATRHYQQVGHVWKRIHRAELADVDDESFGGRSLREGIDILRTFRSLGQNGLEEPDTLDLFESISSRLQPKEDHRPPVYFDLSNIS